MYFQDDFWEAISTLPTRERDACAGALLALYFDGEEDTKLKGTAKGFYVAFRQRVVIAKARAVAGSKGGRKRSRKLKPKEVSEALRAADAASGGGGKTGANAQADGEASAEAKRQQTPKLTDGRSAKQNGKQTAKQSGKQDDGQTASKPIKSERESEGETAPGIQPATLPAVESTTPPVGDAPAASEVGFGIRCLKALNDVLGTAYGQLPPTCARFLAGMEGRYTDEQVRRMVEYKRDEWQGTPKMRRHLTAATLLSPDHFESYMHQSMQEGGEDGAFERFADAI